MLLDSCHAAGAGHALDPDETLFGVVAVDGRLRGLRGRRGLRAADGPGFESHLLDPGGQGGV